MADRGLTHVALPVSNLDASIAFYAKYAGMRVVHRRAQHDSPDREVAWLSDLTRPFALVLMETAVEYPLGTVCPPGRGLRVARRGRSSGGAGQSGRLLPRRAAGR